MENSLYKGLNKINKLHGVNGEEQGKVFLFIKFSPLHMIKTNRNPKFSDCIMKNFFSKIERKFFIIRSHEQFSEMK